MNLNVSVMVGFAALFGVSIMNGVLMSQRITNLRKEGMALDEAIRAGAAEMLRPIAMASLVAMLGLLPASMATGLGSDVQRPLDAGFDLAFSNELRIDHSVTCPIITLRPDADLPIVPVYTNIFAPPLPRPATDDEE